MKSSDELMLVPHEEGFRAWRVRGKSVVQAADSRSRSGADWIALPARNVVSIPMRFQGVDSGRREAAAQLELEAAGFSQEAADVHNFEILSLGSDDRDQRTAAFVQMAGLPPAVIEDGKDAKFAPSVAFRKLNPGEVLIWREGENLVLAVPHESGRAMHCQALAAHALDADAAAEIRCVLAALELVGVLPNLQSVCISAASEAEETVPVSFENALDLPVTVRRETPPIVPDDPARLVPPSVVKLRQERAQRRSMILAGLAFVMVLMAALAAFGARVALKEREIVQQERDLNAREPELNAIREARDAWADLRTAISPDVYPVEVFYQLVLLLPEENIRLVRFEAREDGIVIEGEASSINHAIEFRERLKASPFFSRWEWPFPPPISLPDGRATFRAEGSPAQGDETSTEEVMP
jgi:hypothetical protein